jgi:hypothetical protein
MYRCRTCRNTEPANNYCVFRNNLSSNAGETAGVTTDIGSDPTVSAWTCIFEAESYAGGCMIVAQSFQGVPTVWRNRECVFPESTENRGHQDGEYYLAQILSWIRDILTSYSLCFMFASVAETFTIKARAQHVWETGVQLFSKIVPPS